MEHKKMGYLVLFCFGFIMVTFSLFKIVVWCDSNQKTNQIRTNIYQSVTTNRDLKSFSSSFDFTDIDFDSFINQNSDTVAWIEVKGTNIHDVVVQSDDNAYYLTHSFDCSKNKAGWIFLDYRNHFHELSKNTIIYGHGRMDGSMFGSLKNVLNDDWFQEDNNHFILLSTPEENMVWQVFSVYSTLKENYYITTYFPNDEAFHTFINTLKERSIFSFPIEVNQNDFILTLSTCKDDRPKQRIVLHAKLIEKETRNHS